MLVWYNVESDAEMALPIFKARLRSTQAPINSFKSPNQANVFRRATESISSSHKKVSAPDGKKWDFYFEDLGYDPLQVNRNLIAFQAKSQELYVMGQASFNKEKNTISWTTKFDGMVPGGWMDNMFQIIRDDIGTFMHKNMDIIHSLPIRESIRKAIEGPLNGILVKPGGGLYFVPASEYNGLVALEKMYAGDDKITVGYAPLVADTTQKEMLQDKISRHLLARVGDIVDVINDIENDSKTPTAKKLQELEDALDTLEKKKKTYEAITGLHIQSKELESTRDKLKTLWTGEDNA